MNHANVPDKTHWSRHAVCWDSFGPPLRPHREDVDHVMSHVLRETPQPDLLLLGVTPEYARTAWPTGTRMTAVDRSAEMIRFVWPADIVSPSFGVTQAEWTAMPLAAHAVDAVIGDGITTVLPCWDAIDSLLREVHRVLRPDGLALLRLFVKPVDAETPDQLAGSVLHGPTLGFHSFKLRLLMALHQSLSAGVAPRDAYKWWQDFEAAHPGVLVRHAWTTEQRRTISFYEASPDRYWFPTEAELSLAFENYFTMEKIVRSTYECADRCPLFVLRRKN